MDGTLLRLQIAHTMFQAYILLSVLFTTDPLQSES